MSATVLWNDFSTGHVSSNTTGATVTDGCATVFEGGHAGRGGDGLPRRNGQFTIPVILGTYKVHVRATGFPEQWLFRSSTFERATRDNT